MARLRWMENARTGDKGTVCTHSNKLFFKDKYAYVNCDDSKTLVLHGDTKVYIDGDLDVSGGLSYGSETVTLNQSLQGTLDVGTSGTGYDVTFYADSSYNWLWDGGAHRMTVTGLTTLDGAVTITGALTVGSSDTGHTVTFWGDSGTKYWKWIDTTNTMDIKGDVDIQGATALTGALTVSTTLAVAGDTTITAGSLTVGLSQAGEDALFYGDTEFYQWLWDESGNEVIMRGDWTCVGAVSITGKLTMEIANRIDFRDSSQYIYSSGATVLNIVGATIALSGAVTVDNIITITETLDYAGEDGVTINLNAPLATVEHNWTAAEKITIDQTSVVSGGPAWNAMGRLMGIHSTVTFNNDITNVFGIYSKIVAAAATAGKDVNDVQAIVGVLDLLTTGGGTVTQQSTSMACALKGIVADTSTTCTWEGGCAVLALEFGPHTTFSEGNYLISAWNHAGTTMDAGIHLHPFGTLTTGIDLDNSDSGVFTTGINIDSCATANLAIQGTNATGIALTGTYSANAIKITHSTATTGLVDVELASTFTADSGSHFGIKSNMTITATSGTAFTGDAGQFRSVLDGAITGTCWVSGLHSELEFTSLARYSSSAGIYVALNAIISADSSAVFTSGHIAVLRLATNAGKTLRGTTGICTFIYIDNDLQHSVGGMDSVMCLHSWSTPYLFDLPAGGQSGGIQDTNTSLGTSCVGHIKILFNGTAAYINVTSDNS